jgi:hypothetical protein
MLPCRQQATAPASADASEAPAPAQGTTQTAGITTTSLAQGLASTFGSWRVLTSSPHANEHLGRMWAALLGFDASAYSDKFVSQVCGMPSETKLPSQPFMLSTDDCSLACAPPA